MPSRNPTAKGKQPAEAAKSAEPLTDVVILVEENVQAVNVVPKKGCFALYVPAAGTNIGYLAGTKKPRYDVKTKDGWKSTKLTGKREQSALIRQLRKAAAQAEKTAMAKAAAKPKPKPKAAKPRRKS